MSYSFLSSYRRKGRRAKRIADSFFPLNFEFRGKTLYIYNVIYLYMCTQATGRIFNPILMKFGTHVYFINISAKFVNQQNRTTGSTLLGGENPSKSSFKLIKNTFYNRFLRNLKLKLPLVSPICKPKIPVFRPPFWKKWSDHDNFWFTYGWHQRKL